MLSLKKVIEADHARGWEVKILWYVSYVFLFLFIQIQLKIIS